MFTVIWPPSVNGDFAVIVFAHLDRGIDIEEASHDINDKLESDPFTNGRHISEGLWRIASSPLVAYYSIEGSEVTVAKVDWVG